MAAAGSSPYISDLCVERLYTCVRTSQRWWGVFDRNLLVLLAGVSWSDVSFVRCEKDVPFCRELKDVRLPAL